jgi:acetate---CoA ligase (ADP-forming) subunit beta
VKKIDEIINSVYSNGRNVLTEYESKLVLAEYGIPVVREILAFDFDAVNEAAARIGYPVALKLCSEQVQHKTEKGLLHLDLRDERDLTEAFEELVGKTDVSEQVFLVQEMVHGARELLIGMTRDSQLGPVAMFGLGGIFTEVLDDTSLGVAPRRKTDALQMLNEIRARKILGRIRGMDAVDRDFLGECIVALGNIGLNHEKIQEIDVNPLIIKGTRPVAVDALVVLRKEDDLQD